jgi:hypothetical protein
MKKVASRKSQVLAFLCLIFSLNCLMAQKICPPTTPGGCSPIPSTVKADISTYVGMVGCTLPVKITYCIENLAGGGIQIKVLTWEPDYDDPDYLSPDCVVALNKKLAVYTTGAGSDYSLMMKDLYIHLGKVIINQLSTDLANDLGQSTLDDLSCDNPNGPKVMSGEFYLGSCLSTCYGVRTIIIKGKPMKQYLTVKGDCSSNICCFVDEKYCIEKGSTVGNVKIKTLSSGISNIPLANAACTVPNKSPIPTDCNSKALGGLNCTH